MVFWLKFLDKVANRLTFGKKWETISSRMGTCLQDPKCPRIGKGVSRSLCAALNLIDKNHCIDSIERARTAHAMIMMRSMGLMPRDWYEQV